MYSKKIINKIINGIDSLRVLLVYPFYKEKLRSDLSKKIRNLSVETTNLCNANCIFCAYQYQKRKKGVMSMDLFMKVIDEYDSLGGGDLGLTPTVGDPLLDPHILDRIRYARAKKNINRIGMHTNMIRMDQKKAIELIESGISEVIVSVSGFDEEMYERIYRSNEYQRVFQNIISFSKENRALGSPVDFSIVMRVDQPVHKVFASPDLKVIAEEVGCENINFNFTFDNWGGLITQDQLTGNMKLRNCFDIRKPRISACSAFYGGLFVFKDGEVGACGCRDMNAEELIVGDLKDRTLEEVWFGDDLQKLRDGFLTYESNSICKRCAHYNNISLYLKQGI